MLPGTLLYVYYGKVIGDVAALAGGMAREKGPADYAILILGLVATIVVTTIVHPDCPSCAQRCHERVKI